MREGKFRDDLFFRLNVVRITMPPLRERKEDIPLLVRGFLRHFCKANDKPLVDLTPDAMDALLTYNWPGNVRELRTAIEHGVVMATGPKITLRDLPMAVRQAAGTASPGGISAAKAFGRKIESARSARDGEEIDHASACRDEWQRDRRRQKARHQPANAASKDQRNEPGQIDESVVWRACELERNEDSEEKPSPSPVYFGASERRLFEAGGSPRNGSQNGRSFN